MDEQFEPQPEEKGFLSPPNRRPPTAVGVSTPPPPPPPFHRTGKRRAHRFFRPAYMLTVSSVVGGTALWFLAASIFLKITGVTFAVVGLLWCVCILWINTRAAAAWSVQREYRWIQKRRKDLGKFPRTSS